MAVLHPPLLLLFVLFLLFLSHSSSNAIGKTSIEASRTQDLVRKSCSNASYPSVCIRTLSNYAGAGAAANTPTELAQAAVRVSISRTRKTFNYLAKVRLDRRRGRREKGAIDDCISQMGDSLDELSRTLSELKRLDRRDGPNFLWRMSNAQTWVSAALTNEDTCLDGAEEAFTNFGKMTCDVKRKINNVGKVTSNALYLINRLLLDNSRSSSHFLP